MVGCLEEIAFKKGWIDIEGLEKLTTKYVCSEYGSYLLDLCKKNSAFA